MIAKALHLRNLALLAMLLLGWPWGAEVGAIESSTKASTRAVSAKKGPVAQIVEPSAPLRESSVGESVSDSQIQWVSLLPQDAPIWLENKSLLESLCGSDARPAPQDPVACRREKLQPKIWKLNLYASPGAEEATASLGEVRVQATPGLGFVFSYVNSKGQAQGFKPDLYESDWGYGPFAHQSVRGRQGDWLKLPRRPFPQDVWINIRRDWQEKPDLIEALSRGGVWTADLGGTPHEIVLIEVAGLFANTATLRYRDPDPRDMPCGEEDDPDFPKPDAPYPKPRTLPLRDFLDRDGHWKLRVTYPKGC